VSETETVALVERTELEGLKDLSVDDVYTHVDVLLRDLPGPVDLYRRWERQQWSASALDFSIDTAQWGNFPPFLAEQMELTFSGFFVGEQAVTDTLAPLLLGAPDEEDRLFLSTQVVDEARHAYFFARFFNEVLGVGGTLGEAIARAAKYTRTDAYAQIFHPTEGALFLATDAVRQDPGNRRKWVQSVTVYHLMVESILALTGQRFVLKILRNLDLLPAFRNGFTAVTRDESRHVSYGIWALRRAVGEGYEDAIRESVDSTLQACMRIYANPQRKILIPKDVPPGGRVDPRSNWSFAVESVAKRLRTANVDAAYIATVEARGWKYIWSAIDEYEGLHGTEHPVRVWERGEVAV
jgi:ribonucleoside-diphosphate reductase beta chain